jgi:hypothetical protein
MSSTASWRDGDEEETSMDEIVGNVLKTTDYSKFRRMKGNRAVNPKTVAMLYVSMKKYGWIGAPIVVDENMRVIDGQHRLEAAEMAGIPVLYIIMPGATLDQCRKLNMHGNAWIIMDFVVSYAELGNQHYATLLRLINKYNKSIRPAVIMAICSGNLSGVNNNAIKDGRFLMWNEKKAMESLDYLTLFDIPKIKGLNYLVYAINGLHEVEICDNQRLLSAFSKYKECITNCSNIDDAISQLEYIYNKRHSKATYLRDAYRELADERCAGLPGGTRQKKKKSDKEKENA